MAIFKREHLVKEKEELETFYQRLHAALEGQPGAANLAANYHCNDEQFASDYVDIDLAELNRAVGHFKVVVDDLKTLKGKALKPLHRA